LRQSATNIPLASEMPPGSVSRHGSGECCVISFRRDTPGFSRGEG
jgi:hypothetical protein